MTATRLGYVLWNWLQRGKTRADHSHYARRRGPVTHVIILDGTMSTLEPGRETNAGLTYRLLQEVEGVSLFYEAGAQWTDWRKTPDVITGRGINRKIKRAYGYLASRYREGDRIYLLGYSRGAYAVRSLAGVIDRVGLLRARHATERNIQQIYRLYQYSPNSVSAHRFAEKYCHPTPKIEAVGVWDTVKALGLRLPLLWRLSENEHDFHNHELGASVRHGFHALAHDETRQAFAPVLWSTPSDGSDRVQQVWFRGTHADIGGQLAGDLACRPLSNIPLVWMLEKLEETGLPLPKGWQSRFPQDVSAPWLGLWKGLGKFFLFRKSRQICTTPTEERHPTLLQFQSNPPLPCMAQRVAGE